MDTQKMVNIALSLAGLTEETVDTEIGNPGTDIRRVLAGIDVSEAAMLAAKQQGYDCVAEHHGIMGKAVRIGEQMELDQRLLMVRFGVPVNVAQKAIQERAREESRRMHSRNLDAKREFARFIGMPYLGLHTPADLIGQREVQERMDALQAADPFVRLRDVVDVLNGFPEIRNARQDPEIRVGEPDSFAGRICVIFAGVTGGGAGVYQTLFDWGVGTLVMMHMAEKDVKAVQEQNKGNVVVAGHMGSDSIGMNRILAAWEQAGLEITRLGGLVAPA